MSCTAHALPHPSFEIFRNETEPVSKGKTYIIEKVNKSHVGNYTCVAENDLGSMPSDPVHLRLQGKILNSAQIVFLIKNAKVGTKYFWNFKKVLPAIVRYISITILFNTHC